jgi:hypothetical protein
MPNPTSEATRYKAEKLAAVMAWLPVIQAAVVARNRAWADNTLLYIDGMAGCGVNNHGEESVPGSPVIMGDVLNDLHRCDRLHGLRTRLCAVEKSLLHWTELCGVLETRRESWGAWREWALDVPGPLRGGVGRALGGIINDRLARTGRRPIYGLLFLDPQKPSDLTEDLGAIANVFGEPAVKMDLLLNVASTQWKRTSRANGTPSLTDVMDAMARKTWMISKPTRVPCCRDRSNAFRWHMLIGTNGPISDWRKEGFYDVGSVRGEQLMREATMTKEELLAEGAVGQFELAIAP